MSSIKFTDVDHWTVIERHLAQATGERFAFAFTRPLTHSPDGPVLEVVDVAIVDDDEVESDLSGWCVTDAALDRIHNEAAVTGRGLVEFHNHHIGPPGFSHTDEKGLGPMAGYMLDLLGIPYGAAVWANGAVHAEWWCGNAANVERGQFRSVVVLGDHLRVLNARPVEEERFAPQLPLLGGAAQAAIAAIRVAVVGAGGTGSQVAIQLAYLGFGDVIVLDDDIVEISNLNRLVTANRADVGLPKNLVAEQRMRAIDPTCQVKTFPALTATGDHPELRDVDLILGCVDHDGPRHRLNQIAIETRTPYVDIATGVDKARQPPAIGGRVIFMLPGRPCLTCLGELDSAEVGRWAKSSQQQELDRQHGYGSDVPNPSVIYLNGLTANAAFGELAAWLSGARPPAGWLEIDLMGDSTRPGTYVGPLKLGVPSDTCIDCSRSRHSRQ
jgi:hypothetical protein